MAKKSKWDECEFSELLGKIPPVPYEVKRRKATAASNTKWIYDHLAPGVDLANCPSPGAWIELHICRMDESCMLDFIKGYRTKMISSRTNLDDKDDDISFDGEVTVDTINKIKSFGKNNRERGRGDGSLEESLSSDVGSSPTPAIDGMDDLFDTDDDEEGEG